ncbi:G-type lectin S-receptor-like serine/threonine-protein kinase [Nymphaea thermarum]|nr:G-type lectin S-receptor-like serine/threonine-protein kinase [Nymphaea thermarum]
MRILARMRRISLTASPSGLSFLLSWILVLASAHAQNSLKVGEKLKLNQTIISGGKEFELGFFTPKGSASNQRYLGIWFYNITQTVVWVANRENPIAADDSGAALVLSDNGDAVILDGSGKTVWSAGVSTPSPNDTFARLDDTGNFVITQASTGVPLWESFRHPTDTFLRDMRFSRNTTTKQALVWTSWKSTTDPSPGQFSLGLDHNSSQLYLWNGSVPIWRTGLLKGRTFTGVTTMSAFYIFGFNPETDGDEFSISVSPSFAGRMRFVLDYTGSIVEYRWNESTGKWFDYWGRPSNKCDSYNRCGAFGICDPNRSSICSCLPGFEQSSGGCARRIPIGCAGNSSSGPGSDSSGFLTIPAVKPPDQALWIRGIQSKDDCQAVCLNNCSCTAFAYASDMECMIWTGSLLDVQQFSNQGNGVDIYLRLDRSELGKKKKPWKVAIYVVISTVVAICCAIFFYVMWRHRRKPRESTKEEEKRESTAYRPCRSMNSCSVSFDTILPNKEGEETGQGLPLIDLGTVRAATSNFSNENKLGEGGFGPVYRGKLPEGQEIAVKRLSRNSGQGLEEFMNEVKLIAKLQHRNLVKLVGCCIEEQEKILIYEYMPNKSLDAFLFDKKLNPQLDWGKRFRIVMGIARGLLYLHQDSRLKVVHRDLKASNILLDATLNPKISDFGLARIFGADQSQVNTCRVMGTYGYMSPEYAMEGRFSIKSDVFSFGVLVLEIVSGKRMTRFQHEELHLNLLGYSWKLWKEGKALELLDPSLDGQCNEDEVMRCIHVGLLCVQDEATDRPAMFSVVQMLGSEAANLYEPQMPAYSRRRHLLESDTSSTDGDPRFQSINKHTITIVEAR